jgi:Fur family ferric uptake transcriptional regulator
MVSKEFNSVIMGILHSEKLRATIPRVLVLSALIEKDKELTAIDIHKIISTDYNEDLYISTIYNALRAFEETGIIQKFKVGDQQAFYSIKKKSGSIRAICSECKRTYFINDDGLENYIKNSANNINSQLNSFSALLQITCEHCKK